MKLIEALFGKPQNKFTDSPIGDALARQMRISLEFPTMPDPIKHRMNYNATEPNLFILKCSCGSTWLRETEEQIFSLTLEHSLETIDA